MDSKVLFTSTARILSDKDVSKFTSFASIQDLKSVIPESLGANENLIPFAGNLAVINLANLNGHLVGTQTILDYFQLFEHTRLDLEHKIKDRVCGHIVSVFFTEWDEDYKIGNGSQILSAEDVKDTNKPFNLSIVGCIYKDSLEPAILDKIMESADTKSDDYLEVSLSWEMGYVDYEILLGHSLENGKVVTDAKEKARYARYLKGNKGSGSLKDGTPVNKLIIGEVVPLGAALTLNPAAPVKGIVIPDEIVAKHKEEQQAEMAEGEADEEDCNLICPNCGEKMEVADSLDEEEELECASCKKVSARKNWSMAAITENQETTSEASNNINNNNLLNNSSPLENPIVTNTDNKPISKKMKYLESYAAFEALTDEDLKSGEIAIANVKQILVEKMKELSAQHIKDLADKENAVKASTEKAEKAITDANAATDQVSQLTKQLEELKSSLATKEADDKFQARMNSFNEKYELGESENAILARQLKNVSDEDFASLQKDYETLFASKDKVKLAEAKKKEEEEKNKKAGKPSLEASFANATINSPAVINNSATSDNENFADKFKDAFSKVKVSAK